MTHTDAGAADVTSALADLSARGWPMFEDNADFDTANAAMMDAGVGDGLPLVVPTARRLARMLAGVGAADAMLGRMAPMEGAISPAALAYNAVISGCVPAELPLLQAAALAVLEPKANLLGVQTTTGTPTMALLAHGPVVAALSMNSEGNCLGPGNRANACIGRAMQRILVNVGGAQPGIGDMATMGQPGKYVFGLAEGAHSWLPPLHERRGLAAGDSAVTVFGVSGTIEVLPSREETGPDHVAAPLAAAIRGTTLANGATRDGKVPEHLVLVPPEVLTRLEDAGCSWQDFHALLARQCGEFVPDASLLHVICTGGIGEKMTYLQPWGGNSLSVTRKL